jgi:hypothetical protein
LVNVCMRYIRPPVFAYIVLSHVELHVRRVSVGPLAPPRIPSLWGKRACNHKEKLTR